MLTTLCLLDPYKPVGITQVPVTRVAEPSRYKGSWRFTAVKREQQERIRIFLTPEATALRRARALLAL